MSTRGHRVDRPRASPMFANLSGYLTGLLYGMTGIKLGYGVTRDMADVRPVALPTGWKALRVERLWIHGEPWTLEAQAGNPGQTRSRSIVGFRLPLALPNAGGS